MRQGHEAETESERTSVDDIGGQRKELITEREGRHITPFLFFHYEERGSFITNYPFTLSFDFCHE